MSCVADLPLIKHTHIHTHYKLLWYLEKVKQGGQEKELMCVKMMHTVCVRCTLEVYSALIDLKLMANSWSVFFRSLWGGNWRVVQWDDLAWAGWQRAWEKKFITTQQFPVEFVNFNLLKMQKKSLPGCLPVIDTSFHFLPVTEIYFLLSLKWLYLTN